MKYYFFILLDVKNWIKFIFHDFFKHTYLLISFVFVILLNVYVFKLNSVGFTKACCLNKFDISNLNIPIKPALKRIQWSGYVWWEYSHTSINPDHVINAFNHALYYQNQWEFQVRKYADLSEISNYKFTNTWQDHYHVYLNYKNNLFRDMLINLQLTHHPISGRDFSYWTDRDLNGRYWPQHGSIEPTLIDLNIIKYNEINEFQHYLIKNKDLIKEKIIFSLGPTSQK